MNKPLENLPIPVPSFIFLPSQVSVDRKRAVQDKPEEGFSEKCGK